MPIMLNMLNYYNGKISVIRLIEFYTVHGRTQVTLLREVRCWSLHCNCCQLKSKRNTGINF